MSPLKDNPVLDLMCRVLLLEKSLPFIFRAEEKRKLVPARIPARKVPMEAKERKCCDCATD